MKTIEKKYIQQMEQFWGKSSSTPLNDANAFTAKRDSKLILSMESKFYQGCTMNFCVEVKYLEEVPNAV